MPVPVRRIPMPSEQHFLNKTDEMLEKFIEECEQEAAKLEVTVDYYLAEFVWCKYSQSLLFLQSVLLLVQYIY